ncbi:MAG: hypothetical protein H6Q89_5427 [Myxococcaceae bacterium]|nr:hypothetical protein [Myxococcaceae bacterium]
MMFRNLLMCAALTLAVGGCGRGASDLDDADDAVDTSSSTSTESALLSAAGEETSATASGMTDDQIADAASLKLKSRFKSGCVTATRNLNVVTYVMVDCTGPYGLVKVSGTMVVTYTRQANGSIKADASGTALKVNDGTLDLSAVAVYSKNAAGLETAVVETHGTGTGPKGNTGVRTGNYVVTRDQAAACVTLEGKWSTAWNGSRATSSTEVSGMKKCAGSCPAAGGLITHTGIFGKVLTVTLDGSSVAAWSTTGGKSGTINLACK